MAKVLDNPLRTKEMQEIFAFNLHQAHRDRIGRIVRHRLLSPKEFWKYLEKQTDYASAW